MEKAQEVLNKVSMFFAELIGNEPMPPASGETAAPVKMMEAKLKDGTIVEVSDLAVGGIVTIAGTPAPAGEHELESGDVIVVGDNGAIMEIKPNTGVPTPVVEDMSAKFAAFESATSAKFAAFETAANEKFSAYEVKLSQANKVIEGLMQISKMLVEAPQGAADPSVRSSASFVEEKPDPKEALEKFSKSICS